MTGPSIDPFAAMDGFPELSTARLLLRQIIWGDFPWYLRHFSLPEISEGQGSPPPADEEQARADFERRIIEPWRDHDGLRWGLCLREDDVSPPATLPLIGSAGVFYVDGKLRSCELGYDLDPAYWRRGLMLEALACILDFVFGELGMNRVQALAMPHNRASRGLLERLGFTQEGVMREHSLDERGELVADVLYSLLAREWQGSREVMRRP
jgi:[ribosomal protein S5]-alanine N-acetyltransferase